MDDILHAVKNLVEAQRVAQSVAFTLGLGSMEVKCFTFSSQKPSELVSADGIHVGLVGYLWDSENDQVKLDTKALYFGKPKRGKTPSPVVGDVKTALLGHFTRRNLVGKAAGVFDPAGLVTPITAKIKLDLHELCGLKLGWDDEVPVKYIDVWVANLDTISRLGNVHFPRAVVYADAKDDQFELICLCDASANICIACVYARSEMKDGSFRCQLITAKSKLVRGVSIPRAELKAATLGAVLSHTVKRNVSDHFKGITYATDNTITLYWINQDYRPLQVAVRNSVIEIRRFSLPEQWFHVRTDENIADLGTRPAAIEEIMPGSEWQVGKPWMSLPRSEWNLRTTEEITLSNEEKREALKELRAPDMGGYAISSITPKLSMRYSYSKYVYDPCTRPWQTVLRVVATLYRAVDKAQGKPYNTTTHFEDIELERAATYYYKKGTQEVRQFSKEKDYKETSFEKDGILYYAGRLLDAQKLDDMENVMHDVGPLQFVKPILDRYSPIAYSLMMHCHTVEARHKNAVVTLRESMAHAYIIGGRDLAIEIRNACSWCRRFKRKLLEVEMGPVHKNRLTIAPAFYFTQVDMMGPFTAYDTTNLRKPVKIWGIVFKCTSTCAVACHVMTKSDTESVMMAYTRFGSNHGHPRKLFIDAGSQLMKACREMEISMIDLTKSLDITYRVGIEHSICPPTGHNSHGMVERSIKEVKALFYKVYRLQRLDVMNYETAFCWVANELNNLPICLGSKYRNLDHLDLLTPNRLLLGRANRRAFSGCALIDAPTRLIKQMEEVYDSWWKTWKEEKMADFIPQPAMWRKTTYQPKVGDIVVFPKDDPSPLLGEAAWRLGKIATTELGPDGLVRVVTVQYRNENEEVFRDPLRRPVRNIAVLHEEGTLELTDCLNEATKQATVHFQTHRSGVVKF